MPTPVTRQTMGNELKREGDFGPGAVVSLNLRRGSYLRVAGGFMLNRNQPTARIPAEIAPEDLALLQIAYSKDRIVLGSEPVKLEERADSLAPLLSQLDTALNVQDARPIIMKLLREPRGTRQWTQYDVIQHTIKHEVMTQCRDDLVNYLVDILNNIPGPTPVRELPQDQKVITLTVGPTASASSKLPDYI